MQRDGAAVPAISKLEDLVQGIEDVFLQLLALPAVDESSTTFWIKDVIWQLLLAPDQSRPQGVQPVGEFFFASFFYGKVR